MKATRRVLPTFMSIVLIVGIMPLPAFAYSSVSGSVKGIDLRGNGYSASSSTEISLEGPAILVSDGDSLVFTPKETGAYQINLDGIADENSPRVYFSRYRDEWEDEPWDEIECCDLQQNDEDFIGDYYYAFYAEKGQTCQFQTDLFYDQSPISVTLETSNRAGLTDEGILWRAGNDLAKGTEEAAIVLDIDGTRSNVVIPSSIEGFPVVATGRCALHSGTMETLVVSEGMVRLGEFACRGNSALRNVSLPSTLESTSESNPFENCANMTVEFPNGSEYFTVENSCLICNDDSKLLSFFGPLDLTELHVPDGVAVIERNVLENASVQKLYCPESVTYVAEQESDNLLELHLSYGQCGFDEFALAMVYDDELEKYVHKEGVAVYAPAGGKVQRLCDEFGITFVADGVVQQYYDVAEYLLRGAYGVRIESLFEQEISEDSSDYATLMFPYADGMYYGRFTASRDGEYWFLSQVRFYADDNHGGLRIDNLIDSEGNQIPKKEGNECAFELSAGETYTFSAEFVWEERQEDYSETSVWCGASWRGDNGVWQLEGTDIHMPDEPLVYTGEALRPDVSVFSSGTFLWESRDYDLEFRDNANAGTATVVLTGKGEFSGTATGAFTILPASLSDATVNVPDQVYTGAELTPAPVVRLGGKTLSAETDYTVSYENNQAVGQATVTVTGKRNYTGSATGRFAISSPDSAPLPATPVVTPAVTPVTTPVETSVESSTGIEVGGTAKTTDGSTFKVTSNKEGSRASATYQAPAKSKKSVKVPATFTVNGKTYQVTGIAKGAFKKSRAKTVTIASKKLTKKSVKGCFKGSKVKTVKVPKSKLKAYKKIFTKRNCGAKVKVVAK